MKAQWIPKHDHASDQWMYDYDDYYEPDTTSLLLLDWYRRTGDAISPATVEHAAVDWPMISARLCRYKSANYLYYHHAPDLPLSTWATKFFHPDSQLFWKNWILGKWNYRLYWWRDLKWLGRARKPMNKSPYWHCLFKAAQPERGTSSSHMHAWDAIQKHSIHS